MKHLRQISRGPEKAQDLGIGAILAVVAQVMTVLATALVAKETAGQGTGTGTGTGA